MGRVTNPRSGVSNFFVEVVQGTLGGFSAVNQFGNNDTITTQPADIWDAGRDVAGDRIFEYPFLTSAEILDISSSSGSDTSAGTGARTLEIFGLNFQYESIKETIILNGTSNVSTVQQYLRVNQIVVRSAGSAGLNIGKITAISQSSASRVAQINPVENRSLMAIFTVPAEHQGCFIKYYGSVNRKQAAAIDITLRIRLFNEVFITAMSAVGLNPSFLATPSTLKAPPPNNAPIPVWKLELLKKSNIASIICSYWLFLFLLAFANLSPIIACFLVLNTRDIPGTLNPPLTLRTGMAAPITFDEIQAVHYCLLNSTLDLSLLQ